MKYVLALSIFLFSHNCTSCQTADPISWDDISWIAGEWIGDGFGGVSYEYWSAPIADAMIGTYRHVGEGQNTFYEFFSITKNEDGSFIMKLRHFNPDLNAWEDKEGQLVWEYNGKTENGFTFGPCTYERVGDTQMEITLLMKQDDGSVGKEIFNFKRAE